MDNVLLIAILSMTGLSVLFAGVLAFADKKLRVEEDPMVDKINHLLPGVNCGACGYLSCHDFAEHIVAEGVDPGRCRVVSPEAREELFAVCGVEGKSGNRVVPLICCTAEDDKKESVADYKGAHNCRSANLVFGGGMKCEYGCIGFGDCAEACPFGALTMENGLPRLNVDKCTGCGKCAEACPRHIIKMQELPYDRLFYVACSSHDGPLVVRQVCGVGCIACGICQKLSPQGFFAVKENLSEADYSKQEDPETVRTLAAKCPTKVIKEI